ncbi:MAG TPA: 50S ribosomal protein L24 [Patescibacteria group bacterium]
MKIKINDKVKIIKGKDRGKTGKVIQVFRKEGKVVVEGLNLLVKHMRGRRQGEGGEKIQFNAPLAVENVMLICSKCNQPTRIGRKILENKKRSRLCKKCGEIID